MGLVGLYKNVLPMMESGSIITTFLLIFWKLNYMYAYIIQ